MSCEVTCVLLLFNEAENVEPLTRDIVEVYRDNDIDGEVLLGDDGSTDGTGDICDGLAAEFDNVRVFHHRADPESGHPIDNWNRAWTILHGFQRAEGEIVIIMDGDRQYEPTEIPAFIEKMREGWDVVSGWRHRRADDWWRRLQSRTYNRIFISGFFGMDVKDQNSGFKAFSKELACRMPFDPHGYKGVHRFILPIAYVTGATITEIPIEHYDRPAGRSYIKTYTVPFIFLSDLLFRFMKRFGKDIKKMKKIKRELGRMPSPKDRERIENALGTPSYSQPEK